MPGGGGEGAAPAPGEAPAKAEGTVATRVGPASGRSAQELAEARRRLLEAEGRRRVVSELERRVEQLQRVFLEAERRLAPRAESLGRLGGGVAQAELQLAAHAQRLKRSLRRAGRPPRPSALLAAALRLGSCVPAAQPPESPFRRGSPPRPQP